MRRRQLADHVPLGACDGGEAWPDGHLPRPPAGRLHAATRPRYYMISIIFSDQRVPVGRGRGL